jgi:hypothetical protein
VKEPKTLLEPDVLVAAGLEFGAEVVGVAGAQRAVDAVGGHDQIGVGQVVSRDFALELQPYAQGSGPFGEDLEEAVAADAVALVAGLGGRQVPDAGDTVAPAHRVLVDGLRRLRVVLPELVEQSAPVRDTPAVGRALGVALVDGDVVGRVLTLQQDGEIQTGGPASDTGDLHAHTPGDYSKWSSETAE